MMMEFPSQEKIPREAKIIRDLDRARKKRYMLWWGKKETGQVMTKDIQT